MKGEEEMNKTTSEAPNNVPVVDFVAEERENGGDGKKDGSFAEKENTQLEKGEDEGTQLEDSVAEEEQEQDESDGQQQQEEGNEVILVGVKGGPSLGDGYFEVEAIRRKRIRKVNFIFFFIFYFFYFIFFVLRVSVVNLWNLNLWLLLCHTK